MPNIQYLQSKRSNSGAVEIRIRFYSGREIDQQTHTGIFVPLSLWSDKDGRCIIPRRYETPANKQAREAQSNLDSLAEFVMERYRRDFFSIGARWLRNVVRDFWQPATAELPLADRIQAYCTARNVAPTTAKKIQSLSEHLRNFERHTGIILKASTLTRQQLERFALFLLRGEDGHGPRAQNSVSCRLRQLRTVVYWAGRPHPNPFEELTIPQEVYGTPIYLTAEERDLLYRYNGFTPSQQIQRDIFIFQCHVGCRISDLYNLTAANVRDGWLVYVPQKTARSKAETIEVPLSATAVEIIERYRHADPLGRLLPFASMNYYNKTIPKLLQLADLSRPVMVLNPITHQTQAVPLWSVVTSHTARKTFTQIVYSSTGNKRLVASLTGHSENSQAFNRYSEVTRAMKAAAVLE